jgi:hypothetical protein
MIYSFFKRVFYIGDFIMNKSYNLNLNLDQYVKEKLQYISKKERRSMNSTIAVLIEEHYKEITNEDDGEEEVIIKKLTDNQVEKIIALRGNTTLKSKLKDSKKYIKKETTNFDAYEEALKLRGSKIWEGNLEEMRKGRDFNNGNS